jgi:hypothetical protein
MSRSYYRRPPWALVAALTFMLFWDVVARATDLTVSCTAPTTDVSGNPLPSGEGLTFNLYGAVQGQPLKLLTPTPGGACQWIRTNVTPGNICYAATAVGTLGTTSAESAQTPQVCATVAPPAVQPQPPTGTTVTPVTVATTVYMEVQVANGFSFLAVGTVPLGTPCDSTQRVNNFNVVPATAVTWTGSIHRLAALAACSITN